jgi:tetratricopeptide (TPR) repeat protein
MLRPALDPKGSNKGSSLALYDAFISYSHAKDKPIAAALQSAVQRLGKAWYQRRALRVFRDDTSLSATPHLWPTIEQALAESRFLIVLASPEAAASPWVGKEIAYWLEHKSAETLLVALTDGALAWDNGAGDFTWSPTTPLPPVLRARFAAEPKWVDVSAYRAGASPRDNRFRELAADFAAAIRGIPKEDLLSQEVRQQRRVLRLAWSVAGSLLVLAGLAGWQWQVATAQRDRAERNLTAATGTANTLVFELAQEFRDRGLPVDLVRKLLNRARDLQRQLVSSGEMSPELLNSEAAALCELSTTLRTQGAHKDALEAADTCRAVMEKLSAEDPGNTRWKRQLASSYQSIGDASRDAGAREEALAAHRKALVIREALVAIDPTNVRWQSDLAVSYARIGDILALGGHGEAALDSYRKSLAASEKFPGDADAQQHLVVVSNKLGDTLYASGRREQAMAAYRKGLTVIEKMAADEPDNTLWQTHLAFTLSNIGEHSSGEEALAAYLRALAIRQKLATQDSGNASWQRDLASSYSGVGDVMNAADKHDEALDNYRRSLAILERLAGGSPTNPQWRRLLTVNENKIGDVLAATEKWDEALDAYRKGLAIREQLAAADPGNAHGQYDLAFSHARVARALVGTGQFDAALASFGRAIAIAEKLVMIDPGNAESEHLLSVSLNAMGRLLVSLNRLDEAVESYRKDLAIAIKLAATDPANREWQHDLWVSYYTLGVVALNANRPDDARASFREGLTVIEKLATSNPDQAAWQTELVATLVALAPLGGDALGHYKQALAILQRLDTGGKLPADKKDWIALVQQAIEVLQK